MLEMLSVLAVLSALILVGVVFRPTTSDRHRRDESLARRESVSFAVLGAFPSDEATSGYKHLLEDARRAGVTIDWDMARRVQGEATRPGLTLVAAARRQIHR
jgi:hypothetical protein